MMSKAALKSGLTFALHRLAEPSTYAGLAAMAMGAAEIANEAKTVADTFKTSGPLAGAISILAGVAAVLKPEADKANPATPVEKPDPNIIDATFKEVKPADGASA